MHIHINDLSCVYSSENMSVMVYYKRNFSFRIYDHVDLDVAVLEGKDYIKGYRSLGY